MTTLFLISICKIDRLIMKIFYKRKKIVTENYYYCGFIKKVPLIILQFHKSNYIIKFDCSIALPVHSKMFRRCVYSVQCTVQVCNM